MLFVKMPNDIQQAIEKAFLFLNGGETRESDETPMRLYSFAKDANFIFAAFKATHNIDLTTARLHWYEFLALFMDLGSETTFCQLVSLRKRIKTGKATKDEKQAAEEMGELFDVPDIDSRTFEQKEMEAEFFRKIEQAQRMRNNGN
jgi:hypothetical protein